MADSIDKIESLSAREAEDGGEYQRWLSEITAGEKELDKWSKKARKIVKEFRAEQKEYDTTFVERKFNLFAANTQILQTSLLNQQPLPAVDREFNDFNDDAGRVASLIMERALTYQARKNQKLYSILKNVVQDNLVPGVGVSWHTYKAEIEDREEPPSQEALEQDPNAKPLQYSEVVGEEILDEYVYWEDLVWSPARVWEEVRWLARKVYMTRDQLVKKFGAEKGKKVSLDYNAKKTDTSVETKNQIFQQAVVYEIWDREERKIIWITKTYQDILDKKDDFLNLKEFFPCPKPLFATVSNGQLIPIPDYTYAKDQYRELNEINTRIALLIRACRVVGVYDSSAGQIKALLNGSAENTLVPVDSWAALGEKGGLKGVVDWLPLEQIVKTLEQLYKGREDVKQQIYEVTGMSDIIRGASKASETLGAQKIKAQYASMRIQDRQKAVAMYASSVFDIQAQLLREHVDIQEIARMAQVQQMGENPQLVQQALQLIKSPDFELRCQVESDTLSDIDFQAEKQDRMEFMTAVTNYLKETGGMMTQDQIMGPFLAQLLQFSLAGFRIGRKFEGQLDKTVQQLIKKLSQPQQPKMDPEQQRAQAEIAIMNKEFQLDQQDRQAERQHKEQMNQMELGAEAQAQALKARGAQQDAAMKDQQFRQKMQQTVQEAQVRAALPQPANPQPRRPQ